MQPALFDDPPGRQPGDIATAREMIRANEAHIDLVRAAGFDTVWVEDHMGWADKAHLECFTNMSWLAGRHPGLRYGTLVCGQAFRNPAYLAKLSVNMFLLTEGKFILGLGAGNNPGEHYEYGYEFLPPAERLRQTEDAIKIIQALWSESPATYHGDYYQINNAFSAPRPDTTIPLMLGGMGEKKFLRLVAQYADQWACDVADVELFSRKNRTLDEHCAATGRAPSDVIRSMSTWISVKEDSSEAVRWPHLHIVAGNPDEVTRELEQFIQAGVQHFMIRLMDFPSTEGIELFINKVLPRLL